MGKRAVEFDLRGAAEFAGGCRRNATLLDRSSANQRRTDRRTVDGVLYVEGSNRAACIRRKARASSDFLGGGFSAIGECAAERRCAGSGMGAREGSPRDGYDRRGLHSEFERSGDVRAGDAGDLIIVLRSWPPEHGARRGPTERRERKLGEGRRVPGRSIRKTEGACLAVPCP